MKIWQVTFNLSYMIWYTTELIEPPAWVYPEIGLMHENYNVYNVFVGALDQESAHRRGMGLIISWLEDHRGIIVTKESRPPRQLVVHK